MTTEEIALICELPNYTSFLDASYYLPYSPSVITKYVCSVEEELGIKLFIRSNKSRTLQLSDEGKVLIESFNRVNDDWSYLKKQVEDIKTAEHHSIRIGSQPRFGNIHEQKIITEFLFCSPLAQVSMTKSPADELIRNLVAGKLDAAFITFNKSLDLDDYFAAHGDKILAIHIASENEMYTGISEKYFRGQNEVCLNDLKDFTFAFPFPNENDIQSARAAQSWKSIAAEKGIELKYINLQGYDSTVFEMARQKKIAVTTTRVPSASYEGVKFVKISDWTGGTNLYFLHCPSNRHPAIRQLKQCVEDYRDSL
ncbi:MAG: LysR family transcriptional regulator [Firmicutes bacterium]|nr:LysR family transcriptional regulator [Bacillota bacterium]